MRKIRCKDCGYQIDESDKAWDIAAELDTCPACNAVLNFPIFADKDTRTKKTHYTLSSTRRDLSTFTFIGPLVGAVLLLLITPNAPKDGFLIIVFAYVIGIVPALIAGLIFKTILPAFSHSRSVKFVLPGAISGMLGILPLQIIFSGTQSAVLFVFFSVIGLVSGSICGYISRS